MIIDRLSNTSSTVSYAWGPKLPHWSMAAIAAIALSSAGGTAAMPIPEGKIFQPSLSDGPQGDQLSPQVAWLAVACAGVSIVAVIIGICTNCCRK